MKSATLCLAFILLPCGVFAEDYQPELFQSMRLVYQDDFHSAALDPEHWQPRQGTTWIVKDGVLVGSPSPKEFQEKKLAEGDQAHAGFKPVIWLEKVPENLIVQFRVRFEAEDYIPRFPLIDVGHHVNTVVFSEKNTTLILKKDKKSIQIERAFLPLNTWVDVTIELKRGVMLLKFNDQRELIQDALIDMVDQQQIDFKGIDHGQIRIDDVKVYEGIN